MSFIPARDLLNMAAEQKQCDTVSKLQPGANPGRGRVVQEAEDVGKTPNYLFPY